WPITPFELQSSFPERLLKKCGFLDEIRKPGDIGVHEKPIESRACHPGDCRGMPESSCSELGTIIQSWRWNGIEHQPLQPFKKQLRSWNGRWAYDRLVLLPNVHGGGLHRRHSRREQGGAV